MANAGIYQGKSILDTSLEEWDRMMSINARSVFLGYKLAAIAMIKQGTGGRLIGVVYLHYILYIFIKRNNSRCFVFGRQAG